MRGKTMSISLESVKLSVMMSLTHIVKVCIKVRRHRYLLADPDAHAQLAQSLVLARLGAVVVGKRKPILHGMVTRVVLQV